MILILGLVAVGVLLALLTIGQALSGVQCDFLWFHASYLNSLGSEVGGSGIDAIAVGTMAGAIISAIDKRRQFAAHRRGIESKRMRGDQASLNEETAEWSRNVDLSGFRFTGETIRNRRFSGVRFAGGAPAAGALVGMQFDACVLEDCKFGHAGGGYLIEDSRFVACTISGCDFVESTIRATAPSSLVISGTLQRTRFDGATFDNVEIKPGSMWGCTFWGANFRDSKLPTRLRSRLSALGAIVQGQPGEWNVITRREFYGRPTFARLAYTLATVLGVSQGDQTDPAPQAC